MSNQTEAQRLTAVLELVKTLEPLSTWEIAERIQGLERQLDIWVPSWRTPGDDGHDLEDAMIHLQRRKLEVLRKRVMELEEEFQVRCPECTWYGSHGRGCSRRVAPYVDDNPGSPF